MSASAQKDPSAKFVTVENSRVDEQRQIMEQIAKDQICPFCPEALEKYHLSPTLREGKYWILTNNSWPYEETKHHFLAILRVHAERLQEVPPAAMSELMELFAWVEKEYEIAGGGIAMRFGDSDYSASTVQHIHAHLIVPDFTSPTYKPTRFKIGGNRPE